MPSNQITKRANHTSVRYYAFNRDADENRSRFAKCSLGREQTTTSARILKEFIGILHSVDEKCAICEDEGNVSRSIGPPPIRFCIPRIQSYPGVGAVGLDLHLRLLL